MVGNVSGDFNTALGASALVSNKGNRNTAVGANSGLMNDSGVSNVAIGYDAIRVVTNGSNNIAIGDSAGSTLQDGSSDNTIIGSITVGEQINDTVSCQYCRR